MEYLESTEEQEAPNSNNEIGAEMDPTGEQENDYYGLEDLEEFGRIPCPPAMKWRSEHSERYTPQLEEHLDCRHSTK